MFLHIQSTKSTFILQDAFARLCQALSETGYEFLKDNLVEELEKLKTDPTRGNHLFLAILVVFELFKHLCQSEVCPLKPVVVFTELTVCGTQCFAKKKSRMN